MKKQIIIFSLAILFSLVSVSAGCINDPGFSGTWDCTDILESTACIEQSLIGARCYWTGSECITDMDYPYCNAFLSSTTCLGNNQKNVCTWSSPITTALTITSIPTQTTNTTSFNLSSNGVLSWCGLSLDGAPNITMTLNSTGTYANYTNTSMAERIHTAIFTCNNTNGVYLESYTSSVTSMMTGKFLYQGIKNGIKPYYKTDSGTTYYLWWLNTTSRWIIAQNFDPSTYTSAPYWYRTDSEKLGDYVYGQSPPTPLTLTNTYSKTFNTDLTIQTINIVYPINGTTYDLNVSNLNYTINEGGYCWYSTNNGMTNSTPVTAGTNFTGLTGVNGANTWRIYCNDTYNNLNSNSTTFYSTYLTSCVNLTLANTTYNVQNNLTTIGTCFNILNNNITLDLNGYTINGDGSGSGYGVSVNGYNQTTIRNGTINNFGRGFYIYGGSQNNLINHIRLISIVSRAISLTLSSNNLIVDSGVYTSSGDDLIYLSTNSLNNTFLNVSYDIANELVGSGSSLIRKWYYRAYVNDTNGNAVSNANVTAYNRTGTYQFNLTTGINRTISPDGKCYKYEPINLMTGWNSLSIISNYTNITTGDNKNISIVTGYNLIGHSSYNSISLDNINFTNSSGTTFTYNDAHSQGILTINRTVNDLSTVSFACSGLETYKAYWVQSTQNGNLTFFNIGGSIVGQTYDISKLKFSNGTDEKSFADAKTALWIQDPQTWNQTGTSPIPPFNPIYGFITVSSGNLNSWRGYFIDSNYDNIKLITNNETEDCNTQPAFGYTPITEIIDYINTGTRTYYSNYSIYAEKQCYPSLLSFYNATSNQNNLNHILTLGSSTYETFNINCLDNCNINYPLYNLLNITYLNIGTITIGNMTFQNKRHTIIKNPSCKIIHIKNSKIIH